MVNETYVRMLNRAALQEAASLRQQHELAQLVSAGQRPWLVRLFQRILHLKPRTVRPVLTPVRQTQTSLSCSP
jgi:hypothetical protein